MKKQLLCFVIMISLSLNGCGAVDKSGTATVAQDGIIITKNSNQTVAQMFAMDTFIQMTLYDTHLIDEVLVDIMKEVYNIEAIFSATDESSELYQLNEKNTVATTVSDELRDVLLYAKNISEQTDGAFDITAHPLIRAWGFTTETYRIPEYSELQSLLSQVDYRKIDITENTVLLNGSKIDLGAIVKGYTGDMLAEKLRENGVEKAILSLGGNVAVVGEKGTNLDWNVAIQDPLDDTQYIGYLKVSDTNVITSGGYERYFEGPDGEIYWHIINPKTGYPAKSGIVSVTIVGESGMQCDALSTAFFVMGEEAAASYYRNYDGFEFVLVAEDGVVLVSEGILDKFTLQNKNAEIIIVEK